MSQPDLKTQVTSGILWSGAGRVVQQVIQFALSVVLARLLSPGDYGLMAMVMVFTGFAGMLADAGFNAALVQRQDLKEIHIHTVYWVTLGSGVALAAITVLVSPWLASFYHAPALEVIFRVIAVNFILGAIGNVPSALLQKAMRFKTLAKIEASSLLFSGIVGIGAAWSGAGVWSLVAQSITAAFLAAVFRCWACKWIPKFAFSSAALKDIWGYSGNLYGFNFINYWARNADNLMVGKFFGAAPLGAYNRAYALMLLPITQISSVINQVVFPALSSIQDDKVRVKRIYLRAIGIVTLLAFPMMIGLFVVAKPFVLTVYGPKWEEVAQLLQVLALVGAMQVMVNSTGWIFMSQGRTDVMFKWGMGYAALTISSFVVGVELGSVMAVALSYAVANVLYFCPWMVAAGRVIDMKLSQLFVAVSGSFFGSVVMALGVYAVYKALPSTWPSVLVLAILISVGMGIYGAIIFTFKLEAGQDLMQMIVAKLKKREMATPHLTLQ